MTDFASQLADILNEDPLGLLESKPKASSVLGADERLLASFKEINKFYRKYDREPQASRDIGERRLYSRLKGLRANPHKAAALLDFDTHNLLADVVIHEPKEIETIDEVMDDDPLGLFSEEVTGTQDADDIFTLKHVSETINTPDQIAKRKPCKDFARYEPLFIQCQADLKSGEKELRKFTGEQQIAPGHFFILHGLMVYVADVGEKERKRGKVNARLRCIFVNGTESNMLLRSLATELYKDVNGRRVLDPHDDLFNETDKVTEEDEATGYIYILRSLSTDPKIREIKDLYKIGFSNQATKQRIQNANQEPTYLMADVEVVSEFQTYNLVTQKLEHLIHIFFAEACLNLDVFDNSGKRHTPREWFVAPLSIIETVIKLLINGEIVHYRYNPKTQEIVERKRS